MILSAADSRVNGNAGCNNFFGSWQADGDTVTFGQMGSTMMACPNGMDTEQAFLAALGQANRHQISGLIMELYKGDQLLAKFEAIHF
jgi:heat shock protein HslJ